MQRENAETVGLKALGWIASNDDLLPVFLGASGADVEALKAAADDPGLLGALLDFICMDDAWVTAFCDATGLPYDAPMRARAVLPGGETVHWT